MGRPYDQDLIIELHKSGRGDIGAELARVCIKANLPSKHVATVLGTTRMTVYNWFRGSSPQAHRKELIEKFVFRVREDIELKILPTATEEMAKRYLDNLALNTL